MPDPPSSQPLRHLSPQPSQSVTSTSVPEPVVVVEAPMGGTITPPVKTIHNCCFICGHFGKQITLVCRYIAVPQSSSILSTMQQCFNIDLMGSGLPIFQIKMCAKCRSRLEKANEFRSQIIKSIQWLTQQDLIEAAAEPIKQEKSPATSLSRAIDDAKRRLQEPTSKVPAKKVCSENKSPITLDEHSYSRIPAHIQDKELVKQCSLRIFTNFAEMKKVNDRERIKLIAALRNPSASECDIAKAIYNSPCIMKAVEATLIHELNCTAFHLGTLNYGVGPSILRTLNKSNDLNLQEALTQGLMEFRKTMPFVADLLITLCNPPLMDRPNTEHTVAMIYGMIMYNRNNHLSAIQKALTCAAVKLDTVDDLIRILNKLCITLTTASKSRLKTIANKLKTTETVESTPCDPGVSQENSNAPSFKVKKVSAAKLTPKTHHAQHHLKVRKALLGTRSPHRASQISPVRRLSKPGGKSSLSKQTRKAENPTSPGSGQQQTPGRIVMVTPPISLGKTGQQSDFKEVLAAISSILEKEPVKSVMLGSSSRAGNQSVPEIGTSIHIDSSHSTAEEASSADNTGALSSESSPPVPSVSNTVIVESTGCPEPQLIPVYHTTSMEMASSHGLAQQASPDSDDDCTTSNLEPPPVSAYQVVPSSSSDTEVEASANTPGTMSSTSVKYASTLGLEAVPSTSKGVTVVPASSPASQPIILGKTIKVVSADSVREVTILTSSSDVTSGHLEPEPILGSSTVVATGDQGGLHVSSSGDSEVIAPVEETQT